MRNIYFQLVQWACVSIFNDIRKLSDLRGWDAGYHDCPDCRGNDWEKEDGFLNDGLTCNACGYKTKANEVSKSYNEVNQNQKRYLALKEIERKTEHSLTNLSDDIRQRVLDKITEEWTIIEAHDDRVIMGKPKEGGVVKHGVVALFTLPLTAGLGNLAYHEYKKHDLEKVVLREEATEIENIDDNMAKFKDLKELHDEGILSEEEYEEQKSKLLDEL